MLLDVNATRRAVRLQRVIDAAVIVAVVLVVIVTVVKATGRCVVVSAERAAASDVDEALGAVESAARTLAELGSAAAADDAPRTHAAATEERRQPAARPPRRAPRLAGEPPTAPGEGQLAQQARQSAATAQQDGVEMNGPLGVTLRVEVAGDGDASAVDVRLEDDGEEERDVDDRQHDDDDQRGRRGDGQTAERAHLLVDAGRRLHPVGLKPAHEHVQQVDDDPVTRHHRRPRRRLPPLPPLTAAVPERAGGRVGDGREDPVERPVGGTGDQGGGEAECEYACAGPVEQVLGRRRAPVGDGDEVSSLVLLERQQAVAGHVRSSTVKLVERATDVDVVKRVAAAHVQPARMHAHRVLSQCQSKLSQELVESFLQ